MLWLAAKMVGRPNWPSHKQVVLAACDCAQLALPGGDVHAKACIEVTRRWANGDATLEDVRRARAADTVYDTAVYAAAAYAAAAYADDAAAHAADDAVYHAAAYVADVAIYAAAYAAAYVADAAWLATLEQCAVIVRARISVPEEL
jgi:hypothetical protein